MPPQWTVRMFFFYGSIVMDISRPWVSTVVVGKTAIYYIM